MKILSAKQTKFKFARQFEEVFIHELQERERRSSPNLLKQLQEYIQGEIVYIPKKEQKRAGWGENNGTRIIIERRNREIFRLYQPVPR